MTPYALSIDDDPIDDEYTPDGGGWCCDSPDKADWAIRKIHERRARRDMYAQAARVNIALYERQAAEEREKLDRECANCERDTEFLVNQLRRWFDRDDVPKRNLKASTAVNLPSGKLAVTKPSVSILHDDAKLLPFLRDSAPEYIKTSESVKWADLRSALSCVGTVAVLPSGIIPDGVTVAEKPSDFIVY